MKSMKARKILGNTIVYIILIVLCAIWLLPIIWLVLQSFAAGGIGARSQLIPTEYTFDNYLFLFGLKENATATVHALDGKFVLWFGNTLIVSIITTIVSTFFVLATAYALSRFRFKGRSLIMKLNLVLGMFPGFLSMIIMYWIMKEIFHLSGTIWALIIIYSAGSGMGFFMSKGFFDTISQSIDEAAMIDGATKAQIFWNITLPLSKPIIIYTILTTFMGPWGEYITSSYIVGAQNIQSWTVAMGLYQMLKTQDYVMTYYSSFTSGAICVAIPITLLFMFMQKYYVAGVTGGAVKG